MESKTLILNVPVHHVFSCTTSPCHAKLQYDELILTLNPWIRQHSMTWIRYSSHEKHIVNDIFYVKRS